MSQLMEQTVACRGMLFCLKYYLRREALSTTSLPVLLCLHNTSHSLAVYNLCVCIFLSEIKHHGGRYFTSLFIAICPVPHTKLGVYQEQIKFICWVKECIWKLLLLCSFKAGAFKLLRGTVVPGLALWCLPGLTTCASLGSLGSWEWGMHGKRQPQPAHLLPRPMCSGPGRRFQWVGRLEEEPWAWIVDPETRAGEGGQGWERSGGRGLGSGSRGLGDAGRGSQGAPSGQHVRGDSGVSVHVAPCRHCRASHLALWGHKFHFLAEINDNNNTEIYQGPLYLLPHNHSFIQSANTSLNQALQSLP